MDKEVAGQPLWIWLVAAGGLVLAYLYFKSHSSTPSSGTPSSGGGGGKYSSTSSFRETITDLHSHPSPGKKKG